MKILHILYTYLPDVTGSSIRSEGIVTSQARNGNEVTVLTSPFQRGTSEKRVETIGGVEVHRAHKAGRNLSISEESVNVFKRLIKMFYIFPFFAIIYRLARTKNVDVIHAHSMFFCAYPAYLAARLLGVPFVYEFRSVWEERFNNTLQNKLIKLLETWALKLADSVVVINNGLKNELIERGINRQKIHVVPNAVSDSVLEAAVGFEAPTKVRAFGYVGNFSEIEGLEILIEAFSKAFPKNAIDAHQYKLFFCGRGPFEPKLNHLIAQENDNRIVNCGAFERQELAQVYKKIDAIVVPRLDIKICNRVTPLKPLEAMAFKRLVLGSKVGGILEVCGGEGSENALFFRPESVSSLSELMQTIANKNDIRTINNGANYASSIRCWNNIFSFYHNAYDWAKKTKRK
ncbi:group 1 glycosyl transferase [Catenovulum agarivorans DS-2]|uniref:Group 1 glycosyl transferase n=1 Tax=Catenovulum agarivorans DS-2 TaxID=1328313 RepID=W7QSW7_9ALTE|nr:glycosyltransferase family 4 protein [Catenovulum agarivorans]EWH08495.1 group 1 glycosyl transferase [Catenovulum agarivorans DS-2]